MPFQAQLDRIRSKVELARRRDPGFAAFGANYHRYEFGPPASTRDVQAFEAEFGVRLPADYVAFITTLGNGGPGHFGGAGPQYGVYRLGDFGYMQIDAASMSSPCVITSGLADATWATLTAFDDEEPEPPDYDATYRALFAGLMTIGTQGCNFQTMLALNGVDTGRVVYIDQDLRKPSFAAEMNFLDWYERWADRV